LLREGDTFSSSDDAEQDILEKKYRLIRSLDSSKDQVYFLWTLNQEQLSKIIFPIGHLKKTEVRKLAKKFKLPVAEKKDSQGICFLGDIVLKDFLKHYIKEKNGKVVDEKGQEIGFHDGVVFSTLGARHGFTVTKKTPDDQPYYIVSKDIEKNVLVVSQDKQNFTNTLSKTIQLEKINWINTVPEENKKYTAQIRYHGEFLKCTIKHGGSASAEVIFDNPVLVAPGQSIVLYDKDVVLGGGVVA
jgi:tRNA-specific 2-thiouridylase